MTNDRPKPGYKQTAIGLIPEDWEVATTEQVCELVVDCKNRTPPFVDSSEFAVVRTPNVRDGRFVYEDLRFTDEESFHEWTARAVPKAGDILITREAPLGEVCLVPTEIKVCLGQRMMLYRPDLTEADNIFLLYSLMAPAVQNCLLKKIGGSTVGHAKVNDIRTLAVPLPPLPEQRSISQALSDVDALIAALEKAIGKKRAIKTATMQQLLTGKKRLPGFGEGKGYKESEIGMIPEDWETSELIEKASVIDSLHKTPDFCGDGYPMVRVADIKPGDLRLHETLKVCDSVFEEFTRNYQPKRGDIVLSRVGSYGISSFVETDEPFCLGQNTVVIESRVPPRFLYYALNSEYIREQIEDESYGSGYNNSPDNFLNGFTRLSGLTVPGPRYFFKVSSTNTPDSFRRR